MKFRNSLVLLLLLALAFAAPVSAQSKIVTFLSPQEPDSLNGMYSNMFFSSILRDLYTPSLWVFNDQLEPVPVLVTEIPSAENGGVSEDGRVITITMRDDLTWSDGTPLTSADFMFTIEMLLTPANNVASTYPYGEADGLIASVEAPDATTVVVTFNEPFAPWLTSIGGSLIPEHILRPIFEAEGTIERASWNRIADVGYGPYVVGEWETGSFIRFVRNQNYWGDSPAIDEVIVRFIPDAEAYFAALVNGDGDLGTFLSWGELPEIEATGLYDVVIVASGYNEQWNINVNPETGHPALQDINVRRAIALAVDRERITNDLLAGLTYPPATPWEGTPFQAPELTAYPFDPDLARQLLDEAGWVDSNGDGTRDKDGVELVLRYVTNTRGIRVDTQAVVQQMLADVGIGTVLVNHSSDIFFAGYAQDGPVARGDYDISQWSQTTQFPDPNTSIFLCSQIPTPERPEGGNYRGFCSPELDALFDAANRETDPAAREALFHDISRYIYDQYIYIGIWYDADNWQVSKSLTGVRINGLYPFWNISEWDKVG